MAMNVPRKLYIRTAPTFLKKVCLFMLYPDSKIIGGRRRTRKIELKS